MRANKKDLNHSHITDIIKELRDRHGAPIDFTDVHMVKNFCDFILTFGRGIKENNKFIPNRSYGKNMFVEVKNGNKETTDGEEHFIGKTFGDYIVVRSFEDVLFGMKNASMDTDGLYDIVCYIENLYYNKILKKLSPNQSYPSDKELRKINFE